MDYRAKYFSKSIFLKYQDIFEAFEALDDYDKELIRGLIAQMKKIKNERY